MYFQERKMVESEFSNGVLILGAVVAFHIAAFVFWVYKFSTTSDKRVMDLKTNQD